MPQHKCSETIEQLLQVGQDLKELLITEQSALWSHDLAHIELLRETKQGLSELLQLRLVELQAQVRPLLPSFEGPLTLSLLCEMLEDEALVSELRGLQEALRALQPLVMKNKIQIEKLLESYHESIAFWQRVSSEEAANYDSRGAKAAAPAATTLRTSV